MISLSGLPMFQTETVSREGYGVSAKILWRIFFDQKPTQEQVDAVVEERFPPEGYGPSRVREPKESNGKWTVDVSSYASCG
jgi:hypothetical protein